MVQTFTRHNRGCPVDPAPHLHLETGDTVDFKTKPVNELPATVKFGAKATYTPSDLAAVAKALAKPEAVSNGTMYATKEKARSAAATLRKHIAKTPGAPKTRAAYIQEGEAFIFWIIPTK